MVLRLRTRWFVAYFISALVTACSGEAIPTSSASASPIADINVTPPGVADNGNDPAVVGLVIDGQVACSAALVAPDVVITSMRCVTAGDAGTTCPVEAGPPTALRDPASMQILVGDRMETGALRGIGRDIIVPPGANLCEPDLALIVLTEPVDGIRPLKVRATGVATGAHVRTSAFVVGDAGTFKVVRDHVHVRLTTVAELRLDEACWGMTGGPALDEATGDLVGVASRSVGEACSGPSAENAYMRSDADLDFISGTLRQSDGPTTYARDAKDTVGPVDVGSYCAQALDCAAGVCLTVADTQYCSRLCGVHDRCPARYRCLATNESASACVR
jgi:hypothetical protein